MSILLDNGLARRGRALIGNRSGSAATEFALITLPLLMIAAGTAEYAHAVDNWRKLTALARTVSDLTAQGDAQSPIGSTLMNDIFSASTAVLRPFDVSSIRIRVSALGVDMERNNLKPTVCSSIGRNIAAKPVGVASDLIVPDGMRRTGVRYVLTEASMDYRPMLGSALVALFGNANGTIPLTVTQPWPARGGQKHGTNTYNEVVLPNGAACS